MDKLNCMLIVRARRRGPRAPKRVRPQVRALVRSQLDSIDAASAAIVQVHSIIDDEAHEQFHDFRKSCRAVNDEALDFRADEVPIFSRNATGVHDALGLLADLYNRYGDLNDLWNSHGFCVYLLADAYWVLERLSIRNIIGGVFFSPQLSVHRKVVATSRCDLPCTLCRYLHSSPQRWG